MNTKPEVEIEEPVKDFYTPLGDEHEEGVIESSAISVINAAEISQQISTARRYPRFPKSFRRRAFEMATYDQDGAVSCIYALPRDGKMIDGPSIRFAEILQIAWGNCRSATEVTDIGEEFITSEGTFLDLETNMATKAKIMRRIVNKHGKRFSTDMIATTGNAACSLALRNAILRGVPKALWKDIFDETKRVAAGSQQTFTTRRNKVIKELGIQGVTPDMIFALFSLVGIEDLRTEHLLHLQGLQNAIKDGEMSVEDAFMPSDLKPGEVVPPRPEKSAFDRKPAEAKAEATAPEAQTTGKTETASTAKPDAPKVEEPKPEPATVEAVADAGPAPDAFKDWFKDELAALANVGKIRDLADVRGQVAEQLDGFPDMEKEWHAACDARQQDILNATKKPKGK